MVTRGSVSRNFVKTSLKGLNRLNLLNGIIGFVLVKDAEIEEFSCINFTGSKRRRVKGCVTMRALFLILISLLSHAPVLSVGDEPKLIRRLGDL